jgi:hypothetical protein
VHQEGISLKIGAMIFMDLKLYDAYTMTGLVTALTVLHQNIRGILNKYEWLIFFENKPNQSTFNLFNKTLFSQTDFVTN